MGTPDTKFTKSGGGGLNSIFYANNKRNIIIDTIKIDGSYYNNSIYSLKTKYGIQFDGASNNNTFNAVQTYNNARYGIYLGLSSHHNTITNTQVFNNLMAGIHLYYSSNYNVINNTQTYNNSGYGIWFANGSNRNTINNFQAYNNTVGVF
ncbi:MAG: right-handed parallel beta-helix repeat-containing protein [bacterium]